MTSHNHECITDISRSTKHSESTHTHLYDMLIADSFIMPNVNINRRISGSRDVVECVLFDEKLPEKQSLPHSSTAIFFAGRRNVHVMVSHHLVVKLKKMKHLKCDKCSAHGDR